MPTPVAVRAADPTGRRGSRRPGDPATVEPMGRLLTSCTPDDRRALAVDADRSWVRPVTQLGLDDADRSEWWRRTYRIGDRVGFVRVEARRLDAGVLRALTIWVRPAARRQGLAGAAIGELIGIERLDCVEALVAPDNTAALALFASCGFAAAGHDPTGLLILKRSLLDRDLDETGPERRSHAT
jgi:RimJ/RimL family protein N-acetyltransferase